MPIRWYAIIESILVEAIMRQWTIVVYKCKIAYSAATLNKTETNFTLFGQSERTLNRINVLIQNAHEQMTSTPCISWIFGSQIETSTLNH